MATKIELPPTLKVRFWWADWHPEALFDPIESFSLRDPESWEVMTARDSTWRPPKPGATIQQLRDYMEEHNLAVIAHQCGPTTRRRGHWEGLYELSIGPFKEVDRLQ
jgi:hypothetical protein